MSLVLLPPELRSLCRKLSTAPEQLPNLLPGLLRDVKRCKGPLSVPQDSKTNANSPEALVLVHQLRKQIDSLLSGKTPQGRFVATALAKAVIETGGWECLRASGPWVVKLLAILQVGLAHSVKRHLVANCQPRDVNRRSQRSYASSP